MTLSWIGSRGSSPSQRTCALASYVSRRKPRAKWVQEQGMALAEILTGPSGVRNAVLRERGNELMQARFGPLVPVP